jgi:hypothetical protein
MANGIRALIDSLKRRRSNHRAQHAANLKRVQDERHHGRKGGGDHLGGGYNGF